MIRLSMRTLLVVSLLLGLGGCALFAPPPLRSGMTEAEVVSMLGRLTARYALPQGGQRLEFARGPMGRETWMVDLDAAGRSTAWRQALNERAFLDFQLRGPGVPRAEVLLTLGTPGERRRGGWMGGEVWSWRYPTNDCLWFQVTLTDEARVRDAGYNIDPICDAGDRHSRK
jgi:hypothetical protein